MRRKSIHAAWMILLVGSLACNALLGGGRSSQNPGAATQAPAGSGGVPGISSGSSFPMPDDATNVVTTGGVTTFQTKLKIQDAMNFYRDALGKKGYTERTDHTVSAGGTFSMVFDGDPSGKSLVVQGVDLGNGTVNITLRLENV